MTITIELSEEGKVLYNYIRENDIDTSNLSVKGLLELLEDAEDLHALREAEKEDDGYRISFEDIMAKYADES